MKAVRPLHFVDDSDEALMVRAGTGDRAACQLLVERHLGRIVAFAHRTLRNGSDAEDVAQDVFLRVWAAAPRWKIGTARFTTWLYRVAMNACLDRIAKKRETTADDLPEMVDPRPEPSAAVHNSQVAYHVGAALAALPETQRIALTLCHYQGLRNAEAADVMGVSVEALESLLARGRRTLRARLRAFLPDLLGEE
jgi:RNA polymerase sigma-70 factor (ECF subfamily)